ncbi:putative quinol monooxygenase [Streptomyces sp. NPDC050564]|uniref:putative quinol monooxygenase n=1 Tax=Streptomyces sp. NPDC050564 TaxID=3365631 RepID=UPI00379EE200
MSKPSIVVAALYEIHPDDREEFLTHVRNDIGHTHAKDGCIWYDVAESVVEPNVFRLTEGWEGREHLDAHIASEAFQATIAAVSKLHIVRRVATIYNVVGSESADVEGMEDVSS